MAELVLPTHPAQGSAAQLRLWQASRLSLLGGHAAHPSVFASGGLSSLPAPSTPGFLPCLLQDPGAQAETPTVHLLLCDLRKAPALSEPQLSAEEYGWGAGEDLQGGALRGGFSERWRPRTVHSLKSQRGGSPGGAWRRGTCGVPGALGHGPPELGGCWGLVEGSCPGLTGEHLGLRASLSAPCPLQHSVHHGVLSLHIEHSPPAPITVCSVHAPCALVSSMALGPSVCPRQICPMKE